MIHEHGIQTITGRKNIHDTQKAKNKKQNIGPIS